MKARLTKARTALVLSQPFWGALSLRLEIKEEPGCKTAYTDGRVMAFDPDYVAQLSDAQLKGLMAHEVAHCALGHVWRRGSRDPKRWNVACDYAIDPILVEAGFDVPDATIDTAWRGKSAEEIYALLPPDGDGGGQSGDQGGPQGNGSKKGKGRPKNGPTKGEVRDGPAATATEDEQAWKQAVIQAAQIAQGQGKLPAGLKGLIEDALEPQVNWRALLRQFVQSVAKEDYTWAWPSQRYLPTGLYLPSLRSETLPPIVVAFDTSGSCWEVQDKFFPELRTILEECQPEAIWFLQCDADIRSEEELRPGDEICPRVKGGGGTSFVPVFAWVEERGLQPACLVYLTDMNGRFPKEQPSYPVLWASTTRGAGAPFGHVLYIGE